MTERMTTIRCDVRFLTPAFLGNADQVGQLRTPPFKALLRQWWRVVYAASNGFPEDTQGMRCAEGLLFGNAWLKGKERESKVRLRLDTWRQGTLDRQTLDSHGYLGFGPLSREQITKRAIKQNENALLRLACPAAHADTVRKTLHLIDAYGTLGGRSRNGWGSVAIAGDFDASTVTRPWHEALTLDWAHALGCDNQGPLVWRAAARKDWTRAMLDLADVKKSLRKELPVDGKPPDERHWLAYPVTDSNVPAWGKDARLPNSLRFKVRQNTRGWYYGLVFHMPCRPPREPFDPKPSELERVWTKVHRHLDGSGALKRTAA